MYQTDPLAKRELMNCNHIYMLGRLATADYSVVFPGGETNEPITTMKNGPSIIFYIRPLSEEPSPILKYLPQHYTGNLYIGIDTDQPASILNDPSYRYMHEREKIEYWKKRLENKLVLFKPLIKFSQTGSPYLNLQIVAIEDELKLDLNQNYLCIPRVNMDSQSFENKLLSQSYIPFEAYHHVLSSPAYVICDDYLYYDFKQWAKHETNVKMWKVSKNPEDIKKVRLDFNNNEFYDYTVSGTEYVDFIHEDGEMILSEKLHQVGVSISSEEIGIIPSKPIAASVPASSTAVANTVTKTASKVVAASNLMDTQSAVKEEQQSEEIEFLQELKNATLKEELSYHPEDLVNFHVSVKTNALTIVAGMSGTGKTQLALSYAKVLGLSEEDNRLLFLPISPAYLEPADVLGYLNTTTGLYMVSETGLVDILVNAEKNPDRLYMVVFDEMNLSQVEHWFAPFLSLMELNVEERRLRLYHKDAICYNRPKYDDSILIGDNVIFVGTVNLDETTKDFSDRLLDRANIVTLQKGRFAQLKSEKPNQQGARNFNYEQFRRWVSSNPIMDAYTVEDLNFFDTLHDVISKYDSQKGVSYRFMNKMGCYINNLPLDSTGAYTLTKAQAIDLAVKQRVLTKIKGAERQIGSLIGTTLTPNERPQQSELLALFESEEAQALSSFELTQKEIKRKALELGVYGYTN